MSGVSRHRTRSDYENRFETRFTRAASILQFETSLRRDRLASTPRAHQLPPRSALATACGLGGGTVFVLPKDSRMGGTTTGSAMPVEVENRGIGSVDGSTSTRRVRAEMAGRSAGGCAPREPREGDAIGRKPAR